MPATMTFRTARKTHSCDGCYATARHRDTIRPGHRYIRHVAFPDGRHGDLNQTDHPIVNTECVDCAAHRGQADEVTAGACVTFCHGDTPCALPFGHAGDHDCRRCPEFKAATPAATRTETSR